MYTLKTTYFAIEIRLLKRIMYKHNKDMVIQITLKLYEL